MATCDMGYEHDEPLPATDEPAAPVVVDTGPNENEVEIARIEAAASIEREQIWSDQRGLELEAEMVELRGELRGMREVLDRLAPPEPPEPEPVVIPAPVPEPAADAEPVAAPPEITKKGGGKKSGGGWWDGYAAGR